MNNEDRTKLSDKPWWMMSPGEDKIEDAKFALRCAESFKARLICPESASEKKEPINWRFIAFLGMLMVIMGEWAVIISFLL